MRPVSENNARVSRTVRRNDLLTALVFFSLASLVYTFPLVTAPHRANRLDSPDALLNAWIVSWNLHQLPRDPLHLFDANIFYPEKGTLAYSENLVTGSLLAAPAALVSDNPILLVNVALFGAFVSTGLATFVLAFELTGDRAAALLGGLVFTYAPYRWAHVPHLQLQLAFGIPLSLLFVRWLVAGRGGAAASLGFALSSFATFGSSVYYAVFVASVIPIVAATELYRLCPEARPKAVGRLLFGGGLAVLLTLPLALPYLDKLHSGTFRSLTAASEFSAGLPEYLSSFSWLHGFLPKASEPLFPGFVALGLTVTALVTAPRPRERKWCWATMGVFGIVVSAGPALGLFTFLYRVAAPYRAIRVPSRAGVLVLLAVALLAAIGLTRVRPLALRLGLIAVAAAECFAAPLTLQMEPPSSPAIYRDVEALDTPGALVELPLPPPEYFQDNAVFVYRSIAHWRPLVNGYSGFAPKSYRRAYGLLMRENLARGLVSMSREGVRFVLAHEGRLGPRMRRQLREAEEAGVLTLVSESPPDRLYAVIAREENPVPGAR